MTNIPTMNQLHQYAYQDHENKYIQGEMNIGLHCSHNTGLMRYEGTEKKDKGKAEYE